MRRGTATCPGAAVNVDYDWKGRAAFRYGYIGVESSLELHRIVICPDYGRIGVELLEIVREPLSLLEKRSLVRLQIEFIPAPNYDLLVWCQHRAPPTNECLPHVLICNLSIYPRLYDFWASFSAPAGCIPKLVN